MSKFDVCAMRCNKIIKHFTGKSNNRVKVAAANCTINDSPISNLEGVVDMERATNNQYVRGDGVGEAEPGLREVGDIIMEVFAQKVPKNVAAKVMGEFVYRVVATEDARKTKVFMHAPRSAPPIGKCLDPA